MKRFYIICFDITDNKRRRRSVKLLLNHGMRVQKSVFECLLDDKRYITLKEKLDEIADHTEDSIRYYQLCQNCIGSIQITGLGNYNTAEKIVIV